MLRRPSYSLLAACLSVVALATVLWKLTTVLAGVDKSLPTTSLGKHYSRIIAVAVSSGDTDELQRLLSSMVADEMIVQAAVYLPDGERIALQGDTRSIPALFRDTPQLHSAMVAIHHQSRFIGYLQWSSRPNTD